MSRKVRLPGHGEFWLIDGGALAPRHHCDAEGCPTLDGICGAEESYAHVFEDGAIFRFNEEIGRADDLVDIDCWGGESMTTVRDTPMLDEAECERCRETRGCVTFLGRRYDLGVEMGRECRKRN